MGTGLLTSEFIKDSTFCLGLNTINLSIHLKAIQAVSVEYSKFNKAILLMQQLWPPSKKSEIHAFKNRPIY